MFKRSRASKAAEGLSCEALGQHARLIHHFDDFDLNSFTQVAAEFGQERYGFVVTPNVDHLIRLKDDESFRSMYAAAAYVLLDSRFAAAFLRIFRGVRLPVCTGSDLAATLLTQVTQPADRIVIIGGRESQVARLQAQFGLLNVKHYNPPMGFIREPAAVEACLKFIDAHSPFRFCFIAVGSPQQEALAKQVKLRGVACGLTLCVGAAIDFITGEEHRAPRWMQRAALEWLYRLLQNPRRLAKRYLIRGPRIFAQLRKEQFVLRPRTMSAEIAIDAPFDAGFKASDGSLS